MATEYNPVNLRLVEQEPSPNRPPHCAAAEAVAVVASYIAEDSRAAAEAQADYKPPVPSAYFKEQTVGCTACDGVIYIEEDGQIWGNTCAVASECQQSWASLYPEDYLDTDGSPRIDAERCGGFNCDAVLRTTAPGQPQAFNPCLEGECAIVREGRRWRTIGPHLLNNMPLMKPEASIYVDGAHWIAPGARNLAE